MTFIPDEILTIILSSLPVKSVLRFKCLSKSTCYLIENVKFAKLHLDRSVSNENDLCLTIDDMKLDGTVQFIDLDLNDNYLLELHRDVELEYGDRECKLLGTCNGLVALSEGSLHDGLRGFILQNPSTNRQQLVGNFWGDSFPDPNHEDIILNGFGYDALNDDYKLVRIRLCRSNETAKAVVYSSRAQKSRTLPECTHAYAPIAGQLPGIYVAGQLHWIVIRGNIDPPEDSDEEGELDEEDEEEMIIGFHLTTETFHVVPHPARQNFFSTLGALRGCLAMSSNNPSTIDLEVWVMKEYGVATSWVKIVSISMVQHQLFGLPRPISRVLYLNRKEDKILLEINGTYLIWYNIVRRRLEYFESFANIPSSVYARLISRSFVSPPEAEINGNEE